MGDVVGGPARKGTSFSYAHYKGAQQRTVKFRNPFYGEVILTSLIFVVARRLIQGHWPCWGWAVVRKYATFLAHIKRAHNKAGYFLGIRPTIQIELCIGYQINQI